MTEKESIEKRLDGHDDLLEEIRKELEEIHKAMGEDEDDDEDDEDH